MAYKQNENEIREVLGTFEKNKRGDHVQVTAIEDGKGEISYDIRQMYTNDADELCFTSMGIRMKKDMTAKVLVAILNNLDADTYNMIMNQIDLGDDIEDCK